MSFLLSKWKKLFKGQSNPGQAKIQNEYTGRRFASYILQRFTILETINPKTMIETLPHCCNENLDCKYILIHCFKANEASPLEVTR